MDSKGTQKMDQKDKKIDDYGQGFPQTDCICLEKEEVDSLALTIVFMHQYKDSRLN